jgi:hypothetical protein
VVIIQLAVAVEEHQKASPGPRQAHAAAPGGQTWRQCQRASSNARVAEPAEEVSRGFSIARASRRRRDLALLDKR